MVNVRLRSNINVSSVTTANRIVYFVEDSYDTMGSLKLSNVANQ